MRTFEHTLNINEGLINARTINEQEEIISRYLDYIDSEPFPCIGAKAAISRQQLKCLVVEHLACPVNDLEILKFLYNFIDAYRNSTSMFHSAAIIFKGPENLTGNMFDTLLWQRLQALSDLDAVNYFYDDRVDTDPNSPFFSFSLKEEALFIIGLHPDSSRLARQFKYPVLVFNPHDQFEKLREKGQYEKMKSIIRKRDESSSGSINPMLKDFGNSSEVYQYSGLQHGSEWVCPFKSNHEQTEYNPAT